MYLVGIEILGVMVFVLHVVEVSVVVIALGRQELRHLKNSRDETCVEEKVKIFFKLPNFSKYNAQESVAK